MIVLLVILDQIIKYFAFINRPDFDVLGNFLRIQYIENTGTIFGLLENSNFIFMILSIILCIVIAIYMKLKVPKRTYKEKGFLQTAFGTDAQNKIITTKVDNAKEQMSYDGTNGIDKEYACDPTNDKIFLLSEKEVLQYSKESCTSWGDGNTRIRKNTDYAIANNPATVSGAM